MQNVSDAIPPISLATFANWLMEKKPEPEDVSTLESQFRLQTRRLALGVMMDADIFNGYIDPDIATSLSKSVHGRYPAGNIMLSYVVNALRHQGRCFDELAISVPLENRDQLLLGLSREYDPATGAVIAQSERSEYPVDMKTVSHLIDANEQLWNSAQGQSIRTKAVARNIQLA